ncbi:MAG: tetratricopeptide repeat protein [Elusimicrobiota bacterium]
MKIYPVALLFFLSGCIATSREITELRDDISELRIQMNSLQRNQADLSSKMDTSERSASVLNEKLDDTKNRMSILSQRMDDIYSGLSQRMDIVSEQLSGKTPRLAPTPGELYKMAYGDYTKGKYDLSIVGFRSYLEKYPQGELAHNAQYYLADSYFNKVDYAAALSEFDRHIEFYNYSDMLPSSKYKKAVCLVELKRHSEAKAVFEDIIKKHPNTHEADQSKQKIQPATSP